MLRAPAAVQVRRRQTPHRGGLALLLAVALLVLALIAAPAKAQESSGSSTASNGGSGGGSVAPTPNSVRINADGTMTVDGAPFKIHGVAYSPVPVGESVHVTPFGDYFTPDYVYLWSRDLPAIAAAGFNTLRVYGWSSEADHSLFLDACTQYNLRVILTHYVPELDKNAVLTPAIKQSAIDEFVKSIVAVGDHPALLVWSFGNELNGQWMGYKDAADRAAGCNWGSQYCENQQVAPGEPCFVAQTCMYTELFGFFNDTLAAAHSYTTRPLTSTFADVDRMITDSPSMDRIARFDSLLPSFDFYAFQLYRGRSFNDYFTQYAAVTNKPLLVAEYGVDAFNDPCGWSENYDAWQPCFNYPDMPDALGGVDESPNFKPCTNPRSTDDPCLVPGVRTQTAWDQGLTNEIMSAPKTMGGVVLGWNDEYWKSIGVQDQCNEPCDWSNRADCANPASAAYTALLASGNCAQKAHVTCQNYDTMTHDLCGYWLHSAPDQYVNEAWFGLNAVTNCPGFTDIYGGHRLSALTPRPVVAALTTLQGGAAGADATPKTCEQLVPCWSCANQHTQAEISSGACDGVCNFVFGGRTPNAPSSSSTGAVTSSSSSSSSSSTGALASSSSSSGSSMSSSSSSSTGSDSNNDGSGGVEPCELDPSQEFCGAAPSLHTGSWLLATLGAAALVITRLQ